ncbi:MAG: LicD family protein [Clostridia bacterium]|nr:LicD family protein [Clostridia bacterium]
MRELIIQDDLSNAIGWFASARPKNTIRDTHNKSKFKSLFGDYTVVSDQNKIGELTVNVLAGAAEKPTNEINSVSAVDVNGSFDETPLEGEAVTICLYDAEHLPVFSGNTCFIIADSNNIEDREAMLHAADKVLDALSRGNGNRCVFCVVLPEIPAIPAGVERLAEREYSYFIENYIKEKTPAQEYYIELEKLCRNYVSKGFENISFLRTANVFGPDTGKMADIEIVPIIREIFENDTVKITAADSENIYSCAYITEVLYAMFHLSYNGDKGHIYQYASFRTSLSDIKYAIYKNFQDRLKLVCDCEPIGDVCYHCIDNLKYKKTRPKRHMSLMDAMKRMVCYVEDIPFDIRDSIDIYAGKFDHLKDLEMEMLREIDRLCKENDIDYFLAGGSMLGAVRYNKNIPWDDDIDVAFLRSEFDKFREAADRDLNGKFEHSCWYNETKSHYPIDKIRYKNTFFSTNYSALNNVPDGVFVDLLVHDNTSKNDAIAQLHCEIVFWLRQILEKMWQNLRQDQVKHKFMKVAYPLMKKVPIDFYQKMVEKSLILFKNRPDYGRVIDSTGKIIRRGPMPGEEMHKTKRVPFEGDFMAPIPEDPVPYLTYVYGPNYIQEPPLSKRKVPHNFSRIDLGEYVFESDKESDFRPVDLRGELFEKDK